MCDMLKNTFNLERFLLQLSVLHQYEDLLTSVQRQYVVETGYQNGLPFVRKKLLQSWHSKIIQAWLPYEIHSKTPICFHQNQIRVLLPEFEHSCEEKNCNRKKNN